LKSRQRTCRISANLKAALMPSAGGIHIQTEIIVVGEWPTEQRSSAAQFLVRASVAAHGR
jgi:hypothetical protein